MFTNEQISALRTSVRKRLSPRRFEHTLGVERAAVSLGRLILPEEVDELACAALLHDIAKELPQEEQTELLRESGFDLTENDWETPAVFHSFCAPIIIRADYPAFATEKILSATFRHTVGDEGLSTFDKIIMIADYAEDTRTYPACVEVRHRLFDGLEACTPAERLRRLDDAILTSIRYTEEKITERGQTVNLRMLRARDSILAGNLS